MVDAGRLAVGIDQQVFRAVHETQRCGVETTLLATLATRSVWRRNRFREWRLEAERSRRVDRTQQHLQQMQRAAGMEAVAVRADAAHGVEADWATDHFLMAVAVGIGPRLLDANLVIEGRLGQLAGNAANGVGRNATAFGDPIRRILRIEVAFNDALEHRHGLAAIGKRDFANDHRLDAGGVCQHAAVRSPIKAQRIAVGITCKQPVIGGTRIVDHQPVRIAVSHQVIEVDAVGTQQFVDQRKGE